MAKIKGVWLFNTDLTDAGTEGNVVPGQTVSFTSNGEVFDRMILISGYQSVMTYSNIEHSYSVYTHSDGWINAAFRAVDFGSVEQEVSDEWYAAFTKNARQASADEGDDPEPEPEPEPEVPTGEYYLIKKSTLDGIADAVREKTGETAQMLGSEIEVEIRSIKGGGSNLQKFDGTVEITGQPIGDGGTAAPKLQEKTATENGDVFPDAGYVGLSKVTVNVLSADNPLPIEVATEAEMNALLEAAEVGSVYKYTGETGTYENGALYMVEEEGEANG